MKKFLICVFILAVFSGVVFWFGWTERKVGPGEIGVVFSKTDGMCDEYVQNGKFSWNWQFLLPTNAQTHIFSIEPVNTKKTVTGQLPSADYYTGYNFNYSFTYTISLTVEPQSIIELLKLNRINNDDDLTQYLNGAADVVAQRTTDYLLGKIKDNPKFRVESARRDDIVRAINLYDEYPEVELTVFAITDSRVPDYELYEKLQTQALTSPVIYKTETSSDEELKNNDKTEVENE